MQGTIDERVPQGGASLITFFALPGAALGFLFWLVVDAVDKAGNDPHRVLLGLMMALVVGAGAYTLSVFKGQILRSSLASLVLALATGGIFALAQGGQGADMSEEVIPVAANLVILTVALPFLRSAFRGHKPTDYGPLYGDAWNIPAIVGIAGVFTGAGLLLALLVGALFQFIGLEFLQKAMQKPWFLLPYSGMLAAVGIGVIRQREAAVLAARSIKMALLRVTAPVFALCVTIFVVAVMLRGFGSLIGDLSPVGTLTAAGVVSIIMINAIVGEAGRPEGVLFGATGRLLAVVLLFLMSLAVYGLAMRVMGEGWTPNRIAAAVAILVVALYAPIYAAAGLTEQWAILRQGNIAISALLVVIGILVQTPAFRPYDWSVASQLAIIKAEPEAVTTKDLLFLRSRLGEPGEVAFEALKADPQFADIANQTPKLDRWGNAEPVDATAQAVARGSLRIFPEGAAIPEELIEFVDQGVRDPNTVGVAMIGTELPELWLATVTIWPQSNGPFTLQVRRFSPATQRFHAARGGTISFDTRGELDAVLDQLAESGMTFEERTYRLPVINGLPMVEYPGELVPFEVKPASPPMTPTDPLGPETEAPR